MESLGGVRRDVERQPPLGSWASVAGYFSMNCFRASPLTEPQNWRWPKDFWSAPGPLQWAKARLLRSAQSLPSYCFQGGAMNLFSEVSGSFDLAIFSILSIWSFGSVSRYQRMVYPCSRLCTRFST